MDEVTSIQHMLEIGSSIVAFLTAFGILVKLLSTVHIGMKLTQTLDAKVEKIIENFNILHSELLTLKTEMVYVKSEHHEMKKDIREINGRIRVA